MPRLDLSKYLVHWIKGETEAAAFLTLRTIVSELRILGSNGHIRGGFNCVCFTEAPEAAFHQMAGRYFPFGIRVSKQWLFSLGGRPVIYQRANEYELLAQEHRWRHVRYEPDQVPPIDFSWEREWRINCDALTLPAEEATVVVPHEGYEVELLEEHRYNEHVRITFLQEAWGEYAAMEHPEPFTYGISVLPQPT
jgi:hypothetical protein